ncbi:hypothetical protein ACJQWK_05864 [Exserohilum turcicum]
MPQACYDENRPPPSSKHALLGSALCLWAYANLWGMTCQCCTATSTTATQAPRPMARKPSYQRAILHVAAVSMARLSCLIHVFSLRALEGAPANQDGSWNCPKRKLAGPTGVDRHVCK